MVRVSSCFKQSEAQLVTCGGQTIIADLPEHGMRFRQSHPMRLYEPPAVEAGAIAAWEIDRGVGSGSACILGGRC